MGVSYATVVYYMEKMQMAGVDGNLWITRICDATCPSMLISVEHYFGRTVACFASRQPAECDRPGSVTYSAVLLYIHISYNVI